MYRHPRSAIRKKAVYYVKNPDGSRYCPVTEEIIAQWNREGRVADTAQFLDAVTEQKVEREQILSPVSLPYAPSLPTADGDAEQAQAYQNPAQPRPNDASPAYMPPGYALRPATRTHRRG